MQQDAVVSRLVAAMIDGEVSVHAPGATSDYDTLCGLDLYDGAIGAAVAKLPARAKIDCEQCRSIWRVARSIRATAFLTAP